MSSRLYPESWSRTKTGCRGRKEELSPSRPRSLVFLNLFLSGSPFFLPISPLFNPDEFHNYQTYSQLITIKENDEPSKTNVFAYLGREKEEGESFGI